MAHSEALDFIRPCIISGSFTWADLGAGSGVFTLALAELLGPDAYIYAIDQSKKVLEIPSKPGIAAILPQKADFTRTIELPLLDGILMANALHYVLKKEPFLNRIVKHLKPQGHLLLIEYDRSIPNPWVPYPLTFSGFEKLCAKTNLINPKEINRRPSRYGQGEMYAALAPRG